MMGLGVLALACDKESTSSESAKSVESAQPASKALDPELAQAMAAASAGVSSGITPDAGGGPPPSGIFAPGLADKEVMSGQPPKLTLGNEGAEPRVSLRPAQPKPGTKQALTVRLSVQNAPQQGSLPIDLGLSLEAQKPRGEEGHVDEVPVVARVTSARVGLTGAPRDLEESVAKLKGAKVEYLVLPDGAGSNYRVDVPKGLEGDLTDVVRSLSDLLAVITLPYPDKPVGVGGFWMATSRDGALGLDLVTYRLVKVESVRDGTVTLSVNTKRYAANDSFDIPGLPPDAPRKMVEFQALAQGTIDIVPGKGFPSGGRQESALGAALGTAGKPSGTLEIRTRAEISAPGAKAP